MKEFCGAVRLFQQSKRAQAVQSYIPRYFKEHKKQQTDAGHQHI